MALYWVLRKTNHFWDWIWKEPILRIVTEIIGKPQGAINPAHRFSEKSLIGLIVIFSCLWQGKQQNTYILLQYNPLSVLNFIFYM